MAIASSTALAIAAAASIAGAAMSASSAIQQGKAAKAASEFQAGIMQQQADRERQEAAAKEDDFRVDASRMMARRRALLGARGVEIGEGSPLAVTEDMAGEIELQALRIRNGGELNATRLTQQASLERFRGRVAQSESRMRAGSTLLQGFGQAAWMKSGSLPLTATP